MDRRTAAALEAAARQAADALLRMAEVFGAEAAGKAYLNGQAEPEQPASVAEATCDCDLYSICTWHAEQRPKGCSCNGPSYRSAACRIPAHAAEGAASPGTDPSRLD